MIPGDWGPVELCTQDWTYGFVVYHQTPIEQKEKSLLIAFFHRKANQLK